MKILIYFTELLKEDTAEPGNHFAVEKFNVRDELKSRLAINHSVEESLDDVQIRKHTSTSIRIPINHKSQEYLTEEHNKVYNKISDIELL